MSALVVPVVLVALVVLLVAAGIAMYVGLTRKRESVENAWSQIEVQCERRYDLVPALVESVRSYASHERKTFGELIRARTAAQSATGPVHRAAAEAVFTSALRSTFAVAEAYPQLQASRDYSELQGELAATENRIAYSRQHYNNFARSYNGAVRTFPTSIVAGFFGFDAREYFTAPESAAGPVPVKF